MSNAPVIIRGGGDLGSGVALRLWRCGFRVLILETSAPLCVRRSVSFAEAVYEGTWGVEEARAVRVENMEEAVRVMDGCAIPVLIDPTGSYLRDSRASAVVDAIMAKRNLGTTIDMAPLVVALGPGFSAGRDVDAVIETNRGPNLGRVRWSGRAEPNTGVPGPVLGKSTERVLRSPAAGSVTVIRDIGSIVDTGAVLAMVGEQVIRAPFPGLLRGMIREGTIVETGMKVGDVDPRRDPTLCTLVSDKALAIAGGVVEAIMYSQSRSGR